MPIETDGRNVIIFEDDEDSYADWQIQNPHGYILNCAKGFPRSDKPMLHVTGCMHLARGDYGSTRTYIKVCSEDKDELFLWCSRVADHRMHTCQTCDP